MSVCTAGYKGEAPKGLVREKVLRERGGTTERWVLQRGEAPKGLSTGRLQRGDDV